MNTMPQEITSAKSPPPLLSLKRATPEMHSRKTPGHPAGRNEITPRQCRDTAGLSFSQRQMWVLDQMNPGNPAYNIPHGFRLDGPLNLSALEKSFNEIIKRHEGLRTTFAASDGEPRQDIHTSLRIRINMINLDHLDRNEREARLRVLASEEAAAPFDLARLPLIRVSLFKLGDSEHVLIVNLHHIVADGLSIGLLLDELDALYESFTEGPGRSLPDLPVQYADFAEWQKLQFGDGASHARQIDYWQDQLGGTLPVLDLPTDRPRPAARSFNGSNTWFHIPAILSKQLKSLGASHGCTPFMTMLAAFQLLLHRYSGALDLVVGTPFAMRGRRELQPLIGNFLNMAALRCDLSGNPTFVELLKRCRNTTLDAFSNGELPFETMIEHLKFERDPSRNPVFQVLFQVISGGPRKIGKLKLAGFEIELKFAQFDLSLHLHDSPEGYKGRMEYCTDLFATETIQRMCGHFETLLDGIVRAPEQRIAELPILTDPERIQILVGWNSKKRLPGEETCLQQLFEEQAARIPDQVAVTFEGRTLTYDELNRRANRLAHYLLRQGVGPDSLVALFVERSPGMLVGILGILKAGGAYVPIDPAYPKKRIEYILEDSHASMIVTQESLVNELPGFSGESVCLDRDWSTIEKESPDTPVTTVTPEHLAYVLFTSGSTGRPKGVALEHRSATAFVRWARQAFTPQELSAVLFSTSVCFDLSVFEIFVTLGAGGKIVVARDALHLPALPEKDEVTLVNTVPSAITELVRSGPLPDSVKVVNLAGEALSEALVEQVYATSRCEKVYNLYGPTESTTYSTYTLVRRGSPVTIGGPIAGTQCYILDACRQPVPIGIAGELFIAGRGLARGYYDRPDLTAERFVRNPFNGEPESRMYRTGDLCRWLPDGNIQYLGRLDHQVKLRGFRIELGEIECAIARYPAVREVVVIAREDTPGAQQLVAYVTIENAQDNLDACLRSFIRATLPEYMIPARFVALEKMPRTPNGKIDRRTLPLPSAGNGTPRDAAVAPRTPTEARVVDAFRGALGRTDFGVLDNFFDLGGNSLMAARIILQLRAASNLVIPLRMLFERQTAASLSEAIDALGWVAAAAQQPTTTNDRVEIEI